jgi:hypothetical protein
MTPRSGLALGRAGSWSDLTREACRAEVVSQRPAVPGAGARRPTRFWVASSGSSASTQTSSRPRSRMRARTPWSAGWSWSGPVRVEAAAGRTLQRCRWRGDLIAEVVAGINLEAGCKELGGSLDRGIDLEVEVLGEPRVVRSSKLVRVSALDDPLPGRGSQEPRKEPVDGDHEMDPARNHPSLASGVGHPDQETRPPTSRRRACRLRHSRPPAKSGCRRSSARSFGVSIARSRASRAAETS